ncbi:MAG: translation initiation factor IF-2 [Eubacteriales bacterium]|nr:translation initiation factor IF-2 [Eubacteriales bacterium]
MLKKDKANSGKKEPRAEGKAPKKSAKAKDLAEIAKEAEAAFAEQNSEAAEPKAEDAAPKIEMQGVSGKIITGVVKVVKRKPNKAKAEQPETEDKAQADSATPPVVETVASPPAQPEPSVTSSKASVEPASESRAESQVVPAEAEQPKLKPETAATSNLDRDLPVVGAVKRIGLVKEAPAAKVEPTKEASPAAVKAEPKAAPKAAQTAPAKTATTQPVAAKEAQTKPAVVPGRVVGSKVEVKTAKPKAEATKAEAPKAPAKPSSTEAAAKPATAAKSESGKHEAKAPSIAAAQKPAAEEKAASSSRDLPVSVPPIKPGPVTPGPAGSAPRVVVDTGVRQSSYKGPIIRPQEGSYLGSDADKPVFEKRRYEPRRGRGPQGPKSGAPRGRGRQDFGQDKDKDADEKPRFASKKRAPKRAATGVEATITESSKDQRRRTVEQKRQDSRRRSESDWRAHHQQRERSFEQELLRESRRRRQRKKAEQRGSRAVLTQVKLPESLTVKDLAEVLKKTSAEVIGKLMGYGVMATLNQEVDYDTAAIIASEFGIKSELVKAVTEEDILFDDREDKDEDLQPRPPVVVVMGHVDHGKTSILDYIREAHVTKGEAGGITQHIGAYTVDLNGRQITFLDTPGHEAFTAMRARGAQVTDIAILVVAADDGVMPQTVEAINHARQAGTQIIVAINKIDKPTANIDRVKQELTTHNILSPEWGGDTEMVPVSAKTGEGMDELLEMVLLTADVQELKANPNRQAKGTVIEAYLDRGRGPVATVLVQRGTLHQGDMVVVGPYFGNVRAMTNDRGQNITAAGPSTPVEILGLPDVPEGGEIFYQVENEKVARSLAERRQQEEREQALSRKANVSLDNLFSRLAEGEIQDLNIIVKADVQGSVEAVKQSLEKLSNDEVRLQVIHGSVGAVTESDVRLAEVSEAIIIGFNVRPPASVARMAEDEGVEIRLYQVIYDAIEDMEKAMRGMLAPEFHEVVLGHAEVRETYKVSGIGTIAGCYVTDGVVQRKNKVRCLRDNIVLHDGELASLRRFKDDVREVKEGYECGMSIERFNDIRVGDVFEVYEIREIEREDI